MNKLLINIVFPIVLSIISAIIFWLVFSYFPKKVRFNRIRPKVDQDLQTIVSNLFEIFRIIMSENLQSHPCLYGKRIISGQLAKADIELGLQNKVLNSSCLKGQEIDKYLVPVGERIHSKIESILKKIDELYFFSEFLKSNEILLLEKIKKTIYVNDFSDYPKKTEYLNPSLSYLQDYFFTLYGFYCELLKTLFNKKSKFIKTIIYFDILFPLTEIDYHLYFSKDYKKCKRIISKALKYSVEDIFKFSEIKCDYLLKRNNRAFNKLKKVLKDYKPGLIPISQYIDELNLLDKRILIFIKENYSESDYSKLLSTIRERNEIEQNRKIKFINTNEYLKQHFEKQYFERKKQ